MYNQGLFRDWVPKPVMLLLIVLLAILFFGMNGVYTGNIAYITGSTGRLSEYFMWGNYATVIGMGVAMPLYIRLKARFRTKEILVTSLVACALLFWMMSATDQPEDIVCFALLIGFFKMMGMMEILLPLMVILSKDGNRGRFYSVFYASVLIMTQVTGYYVTWLSYHYNWQYAYIVLAALCLIMAMLCVVFQHDLRFMKKVPLHYIDWFSILLYIVCFMVLAYIFAFGKQQAWFASDTIKWASVIFFGLFFLFLLRQQLLKRPYISLLPFRKNNVRHGLLMLLFLGMYLATATLQNIFSAGILGYNPLINASLNLMLIPGMILAGFVAVKWFNKGLTPQGLIISGFGAFLMYSVVMYFSMVTEFSYNSWWFPMILKGYAMTILFIAIWYYTLDKIDLTSMLSAIGFILIWRTFITLGLFSALFSWFQYKFQLQSLGNLAVYLDDITLFQPGNTSPLRQVQINGILAANKILFGYISIAGIAILLYAIFHHYGRTRYRLLRVRIGFNNRISVSRKNRRRIKQELS